jgi:hypothetical protein
MDLGIRDVFAGHSWKDSFERLKNHIQSQDPDLQIADHSGAPYIEKVPWFEGYRYINRDRENWNSPGFRWSGSTGNNGSYIEQSLRNDGSLRHKIHLFSDKSDEETKYRELTYFLAHEFGHAQQDIRQFYPDLANTINNIPEPPLRQFEKPLKPLDIKSDDDLEYLMQEIHRYYKRPDFSIPTEEHAWNKGKRTMRDVNIPIPPSFDKEKDEALRTYNPQYEKHRRPLIDMYKNKQASSDGLLKLSAWDIYAIEFEDYMLNLMRDIPNQKQDAEDLRQDIRLPKTDPIGKVYYRNYPSLQHHKWLALDDWAHGNYVNPDTGEEHGHFLSYQGTPFYRSYNGTERNNGANDESIEESELQKLIDEGLFKEVPDIGEYPEEGR